MINDRLFAIAWRATFLLLPWQTRLILSTPRLNGFAWEQGTLAIYASWIPLIATVILAWRQMKEHAVTKSLRARIAIPIAIPIVILLITALASSSWSASLLFAVHAALLILFAASLIVRQVPAVKVTTWFLIALIPHVMLGIAQFAAQHVWGSTLFGIAEQPAWKSGVSVVEYGEYRTLRAYGGFPHPNVFGGWLAVALTFLPAFIRQAKTVAIKYAWIACGALFLYILILTFSRGAWIAAFVGLTIAFVHAFRRAENKKEREAIISAIGVFVAALAIALITQWPAVATRFQATERLEQWSVTQRTTAVQDGVAAFMRHPVLGWGPGASLVGIAVARTAPSPVPLEPPHLVPFVILLETGILGLAATLALVWHMLRQLLKEHRLAPALPLLSAFAVLSLTDHYLWTLWAGNGLLIIGIGLLFFRNDKSVSADQRS